MEGVGRQSPSPYDLTQCLPDPVRIPGGLSPLLRLGTVGQKLLSLSEITCYICWSTSDVCDRKNYQKEVFNFFIPVLFHHNCKEKNDCG